MNDTSIFSTLTHYMLTTLGKILVVMQIPLELCSLPNKNHPRLTELSKIPIRELIYTSVKKTWLSFYTCVIKVTRHELTPVGFSLPFSFSSSCWYSFSVFSPKSLFCKRVNNTYWIVFINDFLLNREVFVNFTSPLAKNRATMEVGHEWWEMERNRKRQWIFLILKVIDRKKKKRRKITWVSVT